MGVERALLSVFDKTGIVEFARRLAALNIEILSTGGTSKLLRESGISVKDVSEFTNWPEMLGGRVKTLHPKVHGGLLYRRGHAEDLKQAREHGIAPIDLVVVNLYPFEATATVVTDPADYDRVAGALETSGETTLTMRLQLARKVFAMTSRYDGVITMNLERLSPQGEELEVQQKGGLTERVYLAMRRKQELRYGENPHQAAALYIPAGHPATGLAAAKQLQGKELSYNNYVDLESARSLVAEFEGPAAVIIKHNNPCGVAEQRTLVDAYTKALASDPVSALGGVLAFNHIVDAITAEEVAKLFVECIVAPGFADRAQEIFAAKKNLRLLQLPQGGLEPDKELQLKRILGGMLIQQPDLGTLKGKELKVVTKREPTAPELKDLEFAWKVTKHVKSNAIVFAKDRATIGVGAGQMSRVDSVKIAVMKAQNPLQGSAVASDAFFPFPDGVEEAAKAGATAVIQPGGSVKDPEVIATADRLGLAMVFTNMRHFLH